MCSQLLSASMFRETTTSKSVKDSGLSDYTLAMSSLYDLCMGYDFEETKNVVTLSKQVQKFTYLFNTIMVQTNSLATTAYQVLVRIQY